tara:strand:- start:439 stop:636 length:198 start_codon:yes stop_codon:yes gene_type:complete
MKRRFRANYALNCAAIDRFGALGTVRLPTGSVTLTRLCLPSRKREEFPAAHLLRMAAAFRSQRNG